MKSLPIILLLVGLTHAALAIDEATPSPTPVYAPRYGRPAPLRREARIERRNALQSESRTNARTKAADRRTNAKAKSQAKEAARAREQAQRQVAAESRRESATAQPRPTSDLMQRMGFSQEEIAAQKAREHPPAPAKSEPTPAPSPAP